MLLPLLHRPGKITASVSTAHAATPDGSVAGTYAPCRSRPRLLCPQRAAHSPTLTLSYHAATKTTPSFLKVLWRFTRPHTFIGTALCVPTLHMYAAPAGAPLLTTRVLASILWALLPSGLINVYITGLNQVTDVEIDKINKPYLPIAAGQLSPFLATAVVLLSLVAGLGLGFLPSAYGSRALVFVLLASAFLGTSYSLPPLRLKRFPILAALCIIAVRGTGTYVLSVVAGRKRHSHNPLTSSTSRPCSDQHGLLRARFARGLWAARGGANRLPAPDPAAGHEVHAGHGLFRGVWGGDCLDEGRAGHQGRPAQRHQVLLGPGRRGPHLPVRRVE